MIPWITEHPWMAFWGWCVAWACIGTGLSNFRLVSIEQAKEPSDGK